MAPRPVLPTAARPRIPLPAPPRARAAARHSAPSPATRGEASPGADAAAGLSKIAALANAGRSAEALGACAQQLTQHGPSAELFFWWGLICDGAGQTDAALRHYRKALYLEPYHARALAHLAALLVTHGDHSGAARLQQRLKQRETHDAGKS
ncbi:putative biofilm formation methyltransferase WspC [compost metagenome]